MEVIRAVINCIAFDLVAESKMWIGLTWNMKISSANMKN